MVRAPVASECAAGYSTYYNFMAVNTQFETIGALGRLLGPLARNLGIFAGSLVGKLRIHVGFMRGS